MGTISIQSHQPPAVTVLSNYFIETYMPRANGEFTKVYILLLRHLQSGSSTWSLSSMADTLACTEKDILRALRYWEKQGVLQLTKNTAKEITAITLCAQEQEQPSAPDTAEAGSAPITAPLPDSAAASSDTANTAAFPATDRIEPSKKSAEPTAAATRTDGVRTQGDKTRQGLSSSRAQQLKKSSEEARQILFVTEQYLQKPLSSTDMQRILYFYDELHFSADLIDYLVEYCVSLGKRNINYIEKVGLSWHAEGIDTVQKAKEKSNLWKKDFFTIFKAFGISNRNPIPDEQTCMSRWLQEYGFRTDIICEAARRTIHSIGQPSFQYAEGILSDWYRKKVHTLQDIQQLDAAHRERVQQKYNGGDRAVGEQTARKAHTAKTGFHNFHERDPRSQEQLQQELLRTQMQQMKKERNRHASD